MPFFTKHVIALLLFSQVTYSRVIHNVETEIQYNQVVQLQPELFKIFKHLNGMDFEVGGGVDFNLAKQVERIKLSYGKEKQIHFIPDFEIAWHTHPGVNNHGILAEFLPPSPADIQLAIIGNYNLWLLENKQLTSSNFLQLKSYSENVHNPYVVEYNIVVSKHGVYLYKAAHEHWTKIWQQGRATTTKQIYQLRELLQSALDKNLIQQVATPNNTTKLRIDLLSQYQSLANVNIKFFPWDNLLTKGIALKLNIVEVKSP